VVLDTTNLSGMMIPDDIVASKRRIVIDHHMRNGKVNADIYYSDETKPSCAEIVREIIVAAGKKLDRESALALAAGIITDTAHFRFARSHTLRTMVGILEEGGLGLEEVLALVEDEVQDVSRKIAFLKGAQRVRFEQMGEFVVALSNVSAFEGALSKNLLSLGADVVFVGAQAKKEFRVSGRATQALVRKGFHVGKLMEEAGREMGGQGGGHAGAAGMSGEGEMEAALNILAEKALAALKELKDGR
jgi:nanoRNase/pAp phosphatase (c-di-AMP/oligoRNAs hydrolase)